VFVAQNIEIAANKASRTNEDLSCTFAAVVLIAMVPPAIAFSLQRYFVQRMAGALK
jgi:ABC-type glycerol-3-phosphate transport system permease component